MLPFSRRLLPATFQLDHIRAEKHGGEMVAENLALACTHCNRHKGPNIAGYDSKTEQIVRLFNPRTDIGDQHFEAVGPHIEGRTAIGRATADVLKLNDSDQLLVRTALLAEGWKVRN